MANRKWSNEEGEEYRKSHGALFYFNKDDANAFVPKAFGFGFTLNWANPLSWVTIAVIIGIIVWRVALK